MMNSSTPFTPPSTNRRILLKSGLLAGGAMFGGQLLAGSPVLAQDTSDRLTKGDIAILRFLAAAELIETDLWQQYAELGGVTTSAQNAYQAALSNLDDDGPQYITSNTLDEMSHAEFLNAYLSSKGARPVDLASFHTLQGSKAKGAKNVGRLTNLLHLNVDTSWYTRYRSTRNPDFGDSFPQAVVIQNRPAIPRTNEDLQNPKLIQVLADTAAFHFGTIEQGGSSLYAALSRKVRHEEVLEITLGIGGDEIAHFLEWVDFAGNAVSAPLAPVTAEGLTFPNFENSGPALQPNLIFPVPCEFINPALPHCAVIRPLRDKFAGARATVQFLTEMNLFLGQSSEFFVYLGELAEAADDATRN